MTDTSPEGAVGPIRLAILDDHPLVREGLAALLRDAEPHRLHVAYVGDDVVAALACAPDVVLLDIVMEDALRMKLPVGF